MAFSQALAERVRFLVSRRRGITEKRMFGSLVFLLHGNMLVGIWKDSLIARIGPEAYESALEEEHVEEFDATGRPMRGWVVIGPDGCDSDHQLQRWIDIAVDFVATLPPR